MTQKPRLRVTTDGRVRIGDGFMNMAANLGVGRDKASHSRFVYAPINHYELIQTYRQSWLSQKLIDIVPEDATRNWRQWNAGTDDVSLIEGEEKRHQIPRKVRQGLQLARLTGGAALYMAVKGQEPSEPLDLNRIRKGGLTSVSLFSRYHLDCPKVVTDLSAPNFGEPEYFQLSGIGQATQKIHPSRLAIFNGITVPGTTGIAWEWGDSILQPLLETIKQTEAFPANIISLLYEANVDILTIPNLMQLMGAPPEFEGDLPGDLKVAQYLKTVAAIKGNNGMLVLDGGDQSDPAMAGAKGTTFDRKAITFTGLSDLWDKIMQVASGAGDIPVTRLWGRSPGGLNATGASDLMNYYQNVNSMQANEVTPALENLDKALILSARGSFDDSIYHDWRPLYEESSESRVNRGKSTVEMIKGLSETGLFPDETLQGIAKNALVETGALPGMESAIEEFGLEKDEDEESMLAAALAAGAPQQETEEGSNVLPFRDGRVETLYISRKVLNASAILAHYRGQGYEGLEAASELHVTLAYSRQAVDWMAIPEPWESGIELPSGGPRVQDSFGEASVLLIKNRSLHWRHDEIKEAGASWDHPEYQPHITLAYGTDLSDAQPWTGEIKLGPEIWEPVKPDNWRAEE